MSEQRKKGSRRCALGRGAAASPGMRFTPWAASSESLKKTLRLAAVSGLHGHPQRGPLCSKHAPSVSAKSAPSHAVPALPGTLQSHSSRFVEPSGITRGRAAKPNGWSCCVSSGQAQGAPTRLAQGASSGAKRNLLLCRALAPCATHGAPQRGDQLLCPPSGERGASALCASRPSVGRSLAVEGAGSGAVVLLMRRDGSETGRRSSLN